MTQLTHQIGGFPASVTDSTDVTRSCPDGATRVITAIVDLSTEQPARTSGVEIVACLSGSTIGNAANAVRRMINTAQVRLGAATASPHYLGPMAEPTTYKAAEVVASPPGDARPRLTWGQALAICANSGCTRGHPQVTLAVATAPHSGKIGRGGGIDPTFNHALSYIITSHGHCGLGAGKAEPTPQSGCVSTSLWLVNANTGDHSFGATY